MKYQRRWGALGLLLLACGSQQAAPPPETPQAVAAEAPTGATALDAVLAKQPDDIKSRYPQRHPKEMMEFFGVQPGMTVVDTLPGPVWWTGILLDYLGPNGKVVDADYSPEMWTKFGNYSPDPATKKTWVTDTVTKLNSARGPEAAQVGAVQYGSVPDDHAGTVDVILVCRAMHHFMRLEADGKYLTQALDDMKKLLKPGGIVGVEQHRAPESHPDASTKGDRGYIKQSAVIAAFQAAGFELVDKSEINANPKDTRDHPFGVWTLPPTLQSAEKGEDPTFDKSKYLAIGESDRMTLKFVK